MIYHVYTSYLPNDPEAQRRAAVAQITWKKQQWKELPCRDEDLPRMFREKDRSFPFLRDVWDFGARTLADEDVLVYTNADIMVRSDACGQIAAILVNSDACYCFRRDFNHRVERPMADADYHKGFDYAGSDLFACRVCWWNAYRLDFPDMILGAEAWDPVMRQLMQETNKGAECRLFDVICHERHGSYWENPRNRYSLGMQRHNLALAKAFFMSRQMNPAQFAIR